jgi:hypothetical protein
LAIAAGVASYETSKLLPPVLLQTYDVWFESDLARVYDNMADRWSNHYRTKVHPLFSLLTHPLVYAFTKFVGLAPTTAIRILNAVVAGAWLVVLFSIMRLAGCRMFDAVLFSLIAACSAGAVFWLVVPETYPLGSLSILLAVLLALVAERRRVAEWQFLLVSALTLSVTVTNWMAGIVAALAHHPWRRAMQIGVNAFCIVVVLWGVQKYVFPSAQFFIGDREETKYLLDPDAGGFLGVTRSFFSHSVVMPSVRIAGDLGWQLVDAHDPMGWPKLVTQNSPLGTGSPVAWASTIAWLVLLSMGVWSLFTMRRYSRFRFVLGTVLLGQFVLHSVYGNETFLYSLHFVPLLVIVASLSTLTRARPIALMASILVFVSMTLNNAHQIKHVTHLIDQAQAERQGVRRHIKARPGDPWPRGRGHVVLASPGTAAADKGYLEPGGSFSPSVGSFGVSIWLSDEQGHLVATSDDLPLATIRQELVLPDGAGWAGIVTDTPHYHAQWSSQGNRQWTLQLTPQSFSKGRMFVVIRSIGPAGGPVRSLNWNGQVLTINERWAAVFNSAPVAVDIGEEGEAGWTHNRSRLTDWSGESGWGYARIELPSEPEWWMHIERVDAEPLTPLPATLMSSSFHVDVPDQQFRASLQAQISHIAMGLVGAETRPGDPMNYPAAWLRDGAYELVALTHAGHLNLAQTLARQFAHEDFFGGFGPEADAPGLGIWALEDLALRVGRAEYDRELWPHVRRKAEFIEAMMDTTRPIFQPVKKPIVPAVAHRIDLGLVCEPSQDGLIIGRMDNHRPLLFVNAVSYRGLTDAAHMAIRVGEPDIARRWQAKAERLRRAWERAFVPPESDNDRTYVNSLWPTGVANSSKGALRDALDSRWARLRLSDGAYRDRPLWTYFDIGEAHQWLLLGDPERVWKTLRWFWGHQASPGLYTWWEGDHAENNFHRWDGIRGWLHPPHVTPHYWTAAEMALLQIDMLGYWDAWADEPTVIIGAGIPPDWLRSPMHVSGLSVPGGRLDWNWDGRRMKVRLTDQAAQVRLAAVFPPRTPIQIERITTGPSEAFESREEGR